MLPRFSAILRGLNYNVSCFLRTLPQWIGRELMLVPGEVSVMDVREQCIAGLVRTRLAEDKRTGSQAIDVIVVSGNIYLLGQVDSEDQRQAAKMIVEGLIGVGDIVDNIVVRTHRQFAVSSL